MKVTYFTPEHYTELCKWWKVNNHAVIPLSSLPTGVVVSEDDKNLVMSFIYTMDKCDLVQLAWTTSNPENKLRKNHEAVSLAIDALLLTALKLNKKSIISFSSSRGLTKILNRKNIISNKDHVLHMGSF